MVRIHPYEKVKLRARTIESFEPRVPDTAKGLIIYEDAPHTGVQSFRDYDLNGALTSMEQDISSRIDAINTELSSLKTDINGTRSTVNEAVTAIQNLKDAVTATNEAVLSVATAVSYTVNQTDAAKRDALVVGQIKQYNVESTLSTTSLSKINNIDTLST